MTTFTTTFYAYDKSHRMTTQYQLGGEAHYFTYNERDMITQIQDWNGAGDVNRYFTYNGVGERTVMRDSASNLSYMTYDGQKLLTEKTETGKVYGRYRHNFSQLDRIGSGLEFSISNGSTTSVFNPAFDHAGNTRYAFGSEAAYVSYVYNVVGQQLLAPGGVASGSALTTSRLQGLTGLGFQQLTTSESLALLKSGLWLQAQALFASPLATQAFGPLSTLPLRDAEAYLPFDALPRLFPQQGNPLPNFFPAEEPSSYDEARKRWSRGETWARDIRDPVLNEQLRKAAIAAGFPVPENPLFRWLVGGHVRWLIGIDWSTPPRANVIGETSGVERAHFLLIHVYLQNTAPWWRKLVFPRLDLESLRRKVALILLHEAFHVRSELIVDIPAPFLGRGVVQGIHRPSTSHFALAAFLRALVEFANFESMFGASSVVEALAELGLDIADLEQLAQEADLQGLEEQANGK